MARTRRTTNRPSSTVPSRPTTTTTTTTTSSSSSAAATESRLPTSLTIDLSTCFSKQVIDHELSHIELTYNNNDGHMMNQFYFNGDAPSMEMFHYFWTTLTSKLLSFPKYFEGIKTVRINRCTMNNTIALALFDYSILFNKHITRFQQFQICESEFSFSILAFFVSSLLDQERRDDIQTFGGVSYLDFWDCKVNNKLKTNFSVSINLRESQLTQVRFIQINNKNNKSKAILELQDLQELFQEFQNDDGARYLNRYTKTSLEFYHTTMTLDAFQYLIQFLVKKYKNYKTSASSPISSNQHQIAISVDECSIIPSPSKIINCNDDNTCSPPRGWLGTLSCGQDRHAISMKNYKIDTIESANLILQILEPAMKQIKKDVLYFQNCHFHMSIMQNVFLNLIKIIGNIRFANCLFHDDNEDETTAAATATATATATAATTPISTSTATRSNPQVQDIIFLSNSKYGPSLEVHNDDEHIDSMEVIMKLLSKYSPFVVVNYLDLCSSNMSDREVECISKYLNKTNLKHISFACDGCCSVTDHGLDSLATALQTNTQLIRLDLSKNIGIITSSGLKRFVQKVFKHDNNYNDNTSFKYMTIGCGSIDQKGEGEKNKYKEWMDKLQFYLGLNRMKHIHICGEGILLSLFPIVVRCAKDDPSLTFWVLQTCVNLLLTTSTATKTTSSSCVTLGQKRKLSR